MIHYQLCTWRSGLCKLSIRHLKHNRLSPKGIWLYFDFWQGEYSSELSKRKLSQVIILRLTEINFSISLLDISLLINFIVNTIFYSKWLGTHHSLPNWKDRFYEESSKHIRWVSSTPTLSSRSYGPNRKTTRWGQERVKS